MTNEGVFLSFEGMDGSGKTTQLRLFLERLRNEGFDVLDTAEPGGTRIGLEIRRLVLDSSYQELSPTAELLLYFAARAQNVDEWIAPALRQGRIVVTDRYTDSTLAYQGVGRGLGADLVRELHRVACRGVEPELTLYLEIDMETSLARARKRNEAREAAAEPDETRMDDQSPEFHARVRDAYAVLAAAEPSRIAVIDARQSIDSVAEQIWQRVAPLVERCRVR